MAEQQVDVFISGAGPVGLLLTYQLARLGISTYIIDAADKASRMFPMYGESSETQYVDLDEWSVDSMSA